MQKLKFQIKGMHCNSCALLIEEKLKSHPGIIKAKTSYDSQKTVVIYDEQKIQESEIIQAIKEAGDFQAEKIEEKEEEYSNNDSLSRKEEKFQSSPGNSSYLKLLTSLVILSFGLSIASLIISLKLSPQKTNQDNNKLEAAIGQNLPSQNNPTTDQQQPAGENTTIQNFEISNNNHVRGNFNASVTLVEFSDFECPFCERIYPTLNKILSDYKDKVRLVYKHFPLGFHPNAQKAAEASECADEQGKFWEYHDKLFENYQKYSSDNFKQWAKDLGLNIGKFNDCLDSGKFSQKVKTDYQEGLQKGVNGTPATFVNGQLVVGAQPYEAFKQVIDGLIVK